MPIFEYRCKSCGEKFDVLHKSSASIGEVSCPSCQSAEAEKLLSAFAPNVPGGFSKTYSEPSAPPAPTGGGCANGMCGL
ncbi:MAG: zinc ribbon domain-containing protein [Ignavibacteriales bacterium]|jgi:putative FmdB family regulatory protein|nr:zinc ribbon domain-containing protein [Ignavibacteriales bacterium]